SLPGISGSLSGSEEKVADDLPGDAGRKSLIVNTDGAARGNPGPAAAAAVVFDTDGSEIYSRAVSLGRATNNEAEYRGLILGLDLARALGCREILVRMDSELVVRQMNGEYRIKKEHLRELAQVASGKAAHFDAVRYQHVPRAENSRADKLANDLLDEEARPAG
ncbi:MAG TPA: ribonuclease HI family protein, partial [Candidatus Krumholzibacterium sp.]|nr:ribonuclease HI family protein [Candidatus Krumholzibacterium sp.]